jgi:hypothetical protein
LILDKTESQSETPINFADEPPANK